MKILVAQSVGRKGGRDIRFVKMLIHCCVEVVLRPGQKAIPVPPLFGNIGCGFSRRSMNGKFKISPGGCDNRID